MGENNPTMVSSNNLAKYFLNNISAIIQDFIKSTMPTVIYYYFYGNFLRMNNPIGKYFVAPERYTIIQVVAVSSPKNGAQAIRVLDLRTGVEESGFIEDLDDEDEYMALPEDLTPSRLQAFIEGSAIREATNKAFIEYLKEST